MFLTTAYWRNSAASLLLALAAPLACAGWQDTPDALYLQGVGERMQVNGTPMEIRAFTTDLPMGELLDKVEANWKRVGGQVTRNDVQSWTVLNQSIGDQHRSLQARIGASGAVLGYVALTSPKLARAPKLAVRLPSDMTAVSVIDSVDQGRASQQVIAVSRRSMAATMHALEASLKAEGWQRHRLQSNKKHMLFAANRGNQQFDATLSSERSGSLVMMNTITN